MPVSKMGVRLDIARALCTESPLPGEGIGDESRCSGSALRHESVVDNNVTTRCQSDRSCSLHLQFRYHFLPAARTLRSKAVSVPVEWRGWLLRPTGAFLLV